MGPRHVLHPIDQWMEVECNAQLATHLKAANMATIGVMGMYIDNCVDVWAVSDDYAPLEQP